MLDPIAATGLVASVIQILQFAGDVLSNRTLKQQLEFDKAISTFQEITNQLREKPKAADLDHEQRISDLDQKLDKLHEDCAEFSHKLSEARHIRRSQTADTKSRWVSFCRALKLFWNQSRIEHLQTLLGKHHEQIDKIELRRLETELLSLRQYFVESARSGVESTSHSKNCSCADGMNDDGDYAKVFKDVSPPEYEREKARLRGLLYYQHMNKRRYKIHQAYPGTFQWLWGNKNSLSTFVSWLGTNEKYFRIVGKPGSGKSTLMKKILDDESRLRIFLMPWAGSNLVIASFFFCPEGESLQRSFRGFLQAILFQSLGQLDNLHHIPSMFSERWKTYEMEKRDVGTFTMQELRHGLAVLISDKSLQFCLFIDELDAYQAVLEDDGHEYTLQDFTNYLSETINQDNVKLCFTDRHNLILENLVERPKLRVEAENGPDIQLYVEKTLRQCPRFHKLRTEQQAALVLRTIEGADGVMLVVYHRTKLSLSKLNSGDHLQDIITCSPTSILQVESLYHSIIDQQDHQYLQPRSELMQIIKAAFSDPTVLGLYLTRRTLEKALSKPRGTFSREKLVLIFDTVRRQLLSRWKGLLEISSMHPCCCQISLRPSRSKSGYIEEDTIAAATDISIPESVTSKYIDWPAPSPSKDPPCAAHDAQSTIQFMHSTANDFVSEIEIWRSIQNDAKSFDPHLALATSVLVQLQKLSTEESSSTLHSIGYLLLQGLMHIDKARASESMTKKEKNLYVQKLDEVVQQVVTELHSQEEVEVKPETAYPWLRIFQQTSTPRSSKYNTDRWSESWKAIWVDLWDNKSDSRISSLKDLCFRSKLSWYLPPKKLEDGNGACLTDVKSRPKYHQQIDSRWRSLRGWGFNTKNENTSKSISKQRVSHGMEMHTRDGEARNNKADDNRPPDNGYEEDETEEGTSWSKGETPGILGFLKGRHKLGPMPSEVLID